MPLTTAHLRSDVIWRSARKHGQMVFAMDQNRTAHVETPGPWGVVGSRGRLLPGPFHTMVGHAQARSEF